MAEHNGQANEILVKEYLSVFDEKIIKLAEELRQIIKSRTNPKFELVAISTQSLNIGYGFTRKAWDCYCAIIIYSKHINISFPSGVSLNDPKKQLVGTGKRIRHIKVLDIEDLENPDIMDLILEAKNKALYDVNGEVIQHIEVQTIVKQRDKKE